MKNKFSFIRSIAIILLSIFCINANAQHINYGYDANGNRTSRTYSPMFTMNNTAQNDTEAVKAATQYGIGVYPNPLMDGNNVTVVISPPTQDKTGEELVLTEASEATMYVLDNTGKVLFSKQQTTASPSQLDLSAYSAGIYYIKVTIGKEQLFYKITKAK